MSKMLSPMGFLFKLQDEATQSGWHKGIFGFVDDRSALAAGFKAYADYIREAHDEQRAAEKRETEDVISKALVIVPNGVEPLAPPVPVRT